MQALNSFLASALNPEGGNGYMKRFLAAVGVMALLAVAVMAEDGPKSDSTKPATEVKAVPVKVEDTIKSDSTKPATELKAVPVKPAEATVEKAKKTETGKATEAKKGGNWVTTKSGLKYTDEKVGTGDQAVSGATVEVHYTGWLDEAGKKGKKFDSSVDRGQPFSFLLGAGRVIKGWDEGVAGMKVGGKRTLVIPADLGYGARGAGGVIPGNSTLIFDVELLKVIK
jgi:peptidylprolyl isomerase